MNIDNKPLEKCSMNPITGYNRDGYCNTDMFDHGKHLVCAQMDKRFLDYTETKGNPLRSVVKEGDKWCLCASRWKEAWKAGVAPLVDIEATHEKVLQIIDKELLLKYRVN